MTPVTRYWLAEAVKPVEFSARLIRKVRALNFSVIAHCDSSEVQKALIQALNQYQLEPQLKPQSGQIAICEDARVALAETSNSSLLKLVNNSLLINLGQEPLTAFSRFQRYAEIRVASVADYQDQSQWFQDRGYRVEDHQINEA